MLVFGVSDAQQQFHVLSMSMISHLSKEMYEDMLISFKQLITHVVPEISFIPEYGMTDCEVAERYFINMLSIVFQNQKYVLKNVL